MPLPLQVAFVAGSSGIWRIERITAVAGESIPPAERLAVIEGPEAQRPLEGSWILRGTTSNSRYTNREELKALSVKQEMLLRPQATRAALIGPTFLPFFMFQKRSPALKPSFLTCCGVALWGAEG